MALLAQDIVLRADATAVQMGAPAELHGQRDAGHAGTLEGLDLELLAP